MSVVLVDAATLAGELGGGSPPVVLDVRWRLAGPPGIDSYRSGHLPGAVFVDLDRDLSGEPGPGGRHPMPAASGFQAAMRAAGVRDGYPVVVYDDGDCVPAARAWWMLRYFGHDQVRVLDGGYRAWIAAGGEVADAVPMVSSGDFVAKPGGMPVVDADGAAALARDGVLIDVRTPERYRGEQEPVDPVAGHIPGAVNVPVTETAQPDGTFKDPADLAELFASAGAAPDPPAGPSATGEPSATSGPSATGGLPVTGGPSATSGPSATGGPSQAAGRPTAASSSVGVYCGSGVTAARGVLALTLAGIPAALYVGSWSNWITDPSRPVAQSVP